MTTVVSITHTLALCQVMIAPSRHSAGQMLLQAVACFLMLAAASAENLAQILRSAVHTRTSVGTCAACVQCLWTLCTWRSCRCAWHHLIWACCMQPVHRRTALVVSHLLGHRVAARAARGRAPLVPRDDPEALQHGSRPDVIEVMRSSYHIWLLGVCVMPGRQRGYASAVCVQKRCCHACRRESV